MGDRGLESQREYFAHSKKNSLNARRCWAPAQRILMIEYSIFKGTRLKQSIQQKYEIQKRYSLKIRGDITLLSHSFLSVNINISMRRCPFAVFYLSGTPGKETRTFFLLGTQKTFPRKSLIAFAAKKITSLGI